MQFSQDSRNNLSQQIVRNDDDRALQRGQASEQSNHHVYDAGATRHAITMGPPVTLGSGLRRNSAMLAGTTVTETDVLRPPPERSQRMDLPHHEDHVPVRSRVATIERGRAQGSTCWFEATGACSRNSRTSGKGSGHRTNAPQTYQTSCAQTSASAAHDVERRGTRLLQQHKADCKR
jgi:hypothetical protein